MCMFLAILIKDKNCFLCPNVLNHLCTLIIWVNCLLFVQELCRTMYMYIDTKLCCVDS